MFDQKPGGVEDIFDDGAKAQAPSAPPAGDAAGSVPTPTGGALPTPQGVGTPTSVLPSVGAVAAPVSSPITTPAAPSPLLEASRGFLRGKLLWAILGGAVLVVLVGGGAYLALRGGNNAPPLAPTIAEPQKPAPEPVLEPEAPAEAVLPEPSATPTDTDRDGLSDADEASYGTNPSSADTDNDGLSDADEIRVYKTNPLVPDTDGDGYLDGAEVKGGYDPNGPGRLQDVQKALEK